MRNGVHPTWEDSKNINGGSFSYKINNKYVPENWKLLLYSIIGESISTNKEFLKCVNGICQRKESDGTVFNIPV